MLADERTLEVLDFVRRARAPRGGDAHAARPRIRATDATVRRFRSRAYGTGSTDAMRSLRAASDFTIMPAADTAPLTQAAQLGRTLAPERSTADRRRDRRRRIGGQCGARGSRAGAGDVGVHAVARSAARDRRCDRRTRRRCSIAHRTRLGRYGANSSRRKRKRATASAAFSTARSTLRRFRTAW